MGVLPQVPVHSTRNAAGDGAPRRQGKKKGSWDLLNSRLGPSVACKGSCGPSDLTARNMALKPSVS